jgi:hypothetical protein
MRTASVVATMVAWLCAATACGRLGYTTVDPELADAGRDSRIRADASPGGDLGPGIDATTPTTDGPQNPRDTSAAADTAPSDTSPPAEASVPADSSAPTDSSPPADSSPPPPDACFACPPSSIVLNGNNPTPVRGNTGSARVVAACPDSQVLIGFEGTQARNQNYPWLQSASGICGIVTITGSTITVTEVGKLHSIGGTSGSSWSRRCPPNWILIGFGGTSATWIGVLTFACAEFRVSGTGGFTPSQAMALPDVGAPSGTSFPQTSCPPGQVARGQDLSASTWLDGFGLFCGEMQRK